MHTTTTLQVPINQLSFSPSPMILSDKNDERYAKMVDDVKFGKVKTQKFSSVSKLMTYLNA